MSQLIYDNVTGQYMQLAPHNRRPDKKLTGCPVKWFRYAGFGYVIVDEGTPDSFRGIDVTGTTK